MIKRTKQKEFKQLKASLLTKHLDEHYSRRQPSAFHAGADIQRMALEVAFCFQHAYECVHAHNVTYFIAIGGQMCTDGSHSKETKCVEDANAVDCNVASEVYLVECFVDAGRDLNEEEDDLEVILFFRANHEDVVIE